MRFFSLGGVAKFMAGVDGGAFVSSGVCIYTVTDDLDDKGDLPVTSASGDAHALVPGSWHRTARRAAEAVDEDDVEEIGDAAPDTPTTVRRSSPCSPPASTHTTHYYPSGW